MNSVHVRACRRACLCERRASEFSRECVNAPIRAYMCTLARQCAELVALTHKWKYVPLKSGGFPVADISKPAPGKAMETHSSGTLRHHCVRWAQTAFYFVLKYNYFRNQPAQLTNNPDKQFSSLHAQVRGRMYSRTHAYTHTRHHRP